MFSKVSAKKFLVGMFIIILLAPQVDFICAKENLNNKYFVWKGELKLLSAGLYITYWKVTHRMEVKEYTVTDSNIRVEASCSTNFSEVSFYKDRVRSHTVDVMRSVTVSSPIVYLVNESWGFNMSFLFSPFMIINAMSGDIKSKLQELFVDGYVLGSKRDRCEGYFGGLFFDTWNIELGTYRDVYYMELYYQAAILNRGEPLDPKTGLSNSSVLEINVRIDKSLGIIWGLRFFWYFRQNYHEIKIEIVDTNAIPKGMFYLTLVAIIVAIIVVIIMIRYWRVRRRRRLIRV